MRFPLIQSSQDGIQTQLCHSPVCSQNKCQGFDLQHLSKKAHHLLIISSPYLLDVRNERLLLFYRHILHFLYEHSLVVTLNSTAKEKNDQLVQFIQRQVLQDRQRKRSNKNRRSRGKEQVKKGRGGAKKPKTERQK